MSALPLPIRLAAGLCALAVERARKLPQDVSEWPMTAVSQALQLSMRLQQRITELAIKGDEALAALRETEEDPPWAVFDEDVAAPVALVSEDTPEAPDAPERAEAAEEMELIQSAAELSAVNGRPVDEAPAEEVGWYQAVDEIFDDYSGDEAPVAVADPEPPPPTATPLEVVETDTPAALPSYPQLSLPSVRGRLRRLTEPQLQQLLEYECSHEARPDFVRMLTNRIATVRDQ
jgi:hypothetical protein